MQRKSIITGVIFTLVVGGLSYLLLAAETLSDRELLLIERLESDIAHALREDPKALFPPAGRMTSKFQMGGEPPVIYKLKGTSGRPGRRLTVDFSLQRTQKKAKRKFETRWKHELRANRLGSLEAIPLEKIDPSLGRLAHIRTSKGTVGLFFLANIDRGLLGLTLKGITLAEISDFASAITPTLTYLVSHGNTIMVESK